MPDSAKYLRSKIIGYRGMANSQRIKISGHVFEKHKVWETFPEHSRVRNFKQALKRFRVRTIERAIVEITVNGQTEKVSTDEKGFFTCVFQHENAVSGWYDYRLYWPKTGCRCKGEYFVADELETGVISDIDDTLLVSHSTKWMRKIVLLLFRNAYSRKTIPMVKHWNEKLKSLNGKLHPNGFFYVSNSEWNLYDFLVDFFEINQLPKGIFLLQNLKEGLRDLMSSGRMNSNHKINTIHYLLNFYPQKSFILVGDSGQKDLEIYAEICNHYPDRIKGVMIRKLPHRTSEKRFNRYREVFRDMSVPFIHYY